ncbi:hypothetical protein M441DRAFT_23184 [Trichoderma asperellum CBS 433.97]|uniref:Uncharacterized protein n=1 Tax=Trichoderma asperellum (strain ATCC 204424 / CBS 433.97 / NBRC 101777) TaxID=1042311 RepID=A0A2T3ZJA8_TRIA4|nr:hypothetical protein M441DRAFT_23184 [Trichoderma asperellum CBS 433.97]PTB44853.1 hypothetical protein M441DRAFT_23184 [Trichoderma asperellum CBS 433.97]
MSQIRAFIVYVHGCPGFLNAAICVELSQLIDHSRVIKMGVNPNNRTLRARLSSSSMSIDRETLLYLRSVLADTLRDSNQATRRSWIFSDFRGATSTHNTLPVEDYENAADKVDLPFIHVILRCNSRKLRSLSVVGESLRNVNAVDFAVFESIRKREEIRATGKANELELDISDLDQAEAAGKIFERIPKILELYE